MNKCIITGRLTRDPEFREVGGEHIAVCKFGVAVRRKVKTADKDVDFFDVVAWRGTAETCNKFLVKGDMVGVVGAMQQTEYTDKDGNKRVSWALQAESVDFLSAKGESKPTAEKEPEKAERKKVTVEQMTLVADDDLPF